MASLQERNGSYRILFCHHGKLHTFTTGKVERYGAENKARKVDYLLMRLKQRLLVLPEGTDIVSFIEHDGKPPDAVYTLPRAPRQVVTVTILRDRYLATHRNGAIEANSLDAWKLHLCHFARSRWRLPTRRAVSLAELPKYVNRRAASKISPVTIRKEIATGRTIKDRRPRLAERFIRWLRQRRQSVRVSLVAGGLVALHLCGAILAWNGWKAYKGAEYRPRPGIPASRDVEAGRAARRGSRPIG